jgi:hypothetical protein
LAEINESAATFSVRGGTELEFAAKHGEQQVRRARALKKSLWIWPSTNVAIGDRNDMNASVSGSAIGYVTGNGGFHELMEVG